MSTNASGVVFSSTAGTRSNSRRSVTGCPVTTSPPCSSSAVTIASASFCDPPSISGHPTWWDSIASSIPSAEVSGWLRSSMPCAAAPPTSARASSVSKYRCASHRTLGSPLSPKWTICGTLRVGGRRSCGSGRSR